MEQFACQTTVLVGEGAGSALSDLAGKRFSLVMGSGLSGNRELSFLQEKAEKGWLVEIEDGGGKPVVGQIVTGARKLQEVEPEELVAVGNEVVIDCAKAIRGFGKLSCQLTIVSTGVPSGRDVTNLISLDHERRRHTLREEALRPDRIILDSHLFLETDKRRVSETGFALLGRSLEIYTGKSRGEFSDLHAKEAFCALWAALPGCISGKIEARGRVQLASVLVGMGWERTGLGLCSALCASLESVFSLPPGKLAAVFLPPVVKQHGYGSGRRYAYLARAAGMGGGNEGTGLKNLYGGLLRLRRELNLAETLQQTGLPPDKVWNCIASIVEQTLENPDCRNDPLEADAFLIRRILAEAMGRS